MITLNGSLTSTNGNIALVDTTQFVNNAGSSALSATNGYIWQVWSVNPPGSGQSTVDSDGGLTPDFIQYNATYGTTTPAASGNGLTLLLRQPSLLVQTLNGTFTKQYDGTENLTIGANSYTYTTSGQVSGDSVSFSTSSALSGTLNSPDVNLANTVTVNPAELFPSAPTRGSIPVYGYTGDFATGAHSPRPRRLRPASLTVARARATSSPRPMTAPTAPWALCDGSRWATPLYEILSAPGFRTA